jgi:glycosyltransferase involved in cell wall biosynthesis
LTKNRIVVSVISDLVSDQRVHRICRFLHENNFSVTLIGRKFNNSLPLNTRSYTAKRINCYFSKGFLQYAEYNLKLFIYLFFFRADIFLSNDLDTLLPNYIHAKLRNKKIVYDSHEYFTGVPELQRKPFKRKVWKWLERVLLPKIRYAYTVNESIANLYKAETGLNMKVVRNTPFLDDKGSETSIRFFPSDKIILLLQGAGINRGRGADELVKSMQYLPSKFLLVLIGSGNIWEELKDLHIKLHLQEKVRFIEKVPFDQLREYTKQADLGISVDIPFCLNYQLSLPNKIFDYIHAGVPVLASEIQEVRNILEKYQVGTTISVLTPESIAKAILAIFSNKDRYLFWKKNTESAAKELCWQKEQEVLKDIFNIG